jgi:hypothetical protein
MFNMILRLLPLIATAVDASRDDAQAPTTTSTHDVRVKAAAISTFICLMAFFTNRLCVLHLMRLRNAARLQNNAFVAWQYNNQLILVTLAEKLNVIFTLNSFKNLVDALYNPTKSPLQESVDIE